MRTLETISITNFKSIREQTLRLAPLNVFIGANGSGKSNLIEVFHFLNQVADRQLQLYTAVAGGADSILHFGRKKSPKLRITLEFGVESVVHGYMLETVPTDADEFVFRIEGIWNGPREPERQLNLVLGVAHRESGLRESNDSAALSVLANLNDFRQYHFHDTSSSAPVKQTCDVNDNRFLHADGGNLAAFVHRLQQTDPGHFRNIEATIQQVAPFFAGFRLEPSRLNPNNILLEWQHTSSDAYFNANALSDGTLRFMCLATLLLQPDPPKMILLDEPELGLHPAAIVLLAALLQSAATRTQIIVATQSVTLVNQLTPKEVWIVDREDDQSVFKHLDFADMSDWLEDYALGELWEKNIIGGRP